MIFQKLLSEIDGGKILDVGCGSGQFTEILAGSLRSFESLTGIDIAEEYLAEARQKFKDDIFEFIMAGSLDMPFEDDAFDLVAVSKALHHMEDPGASLAEMKRVLKPGGYFLIVEMHRDQLTHAQESHALYHHLRSEIDTLLGINHNHTFYRNDLISLVDELNLKDRIIMEYLPDPSNAKDPENIKEFIDKMYKWLIPLNGHPSKEEFAWRIDGLKNKFREDGIARPPQMIFLGKK